MLIKTDLIRSPEDLNMFVIIDGHQYPINETDLFIPLKRGYHDAIVEVYGKNSQVFKARLFKKSIYPHLISLSSEIHSFATKYRFYVKREDSIIELKLSNEVKKDFLNNDMKCGGVSIISKNVEVTKTGHFTFLTKKEKIKFTLIQCINIVTVMFVYFLLWTINFKKTLYWLKSDDPFVLEYVYSSIGGPKGYLIVYLIPFFILIFARTIFFIIKLRKMLHTMAVKNTGDGSMC